MIIEELKVSNIRNINTLALSFSPGFNFIFGDNGSGKTSLLEAIYLLHTAKSFRTHQVQPIIQFGAPSCTVFAKCSDNVSLGLQKSAKETKIKVNQSPISSVSQLALFFPLVVLYQDIFSILDDGPTVRRKQLDWGVFHVEHSFQFAWKSFQRILNQRNKLLRSCPTQAELTVWDEQLLSHAEEITSCRLKYIEKLTPIFQEILNLFKLPKLTLRFFQGWNEQLPFSVVLDRNFLKDNKLRSTSEGPHRADLLFCQDGRLIKQHFSRGQKKLLLFAFKFAQARLLTKEAIFLIDDIDAELDSKAKKKVMHYLLDNVKQTILTSLSQESMTPWLGDNYHQLQNTAL